MESEVLHNGAIVSPTFAMGISGNSGGSLSYLEADKLLYSVGVMAAVLEHESNAMRFVSTHSSVRGITAIAVSGNKKYFACVETVSDDKPQQVSIYNVQGEGRVKALNLEPHMGGSSKLLITQCGAPDNTLLIWRWFTNKVLAVVNVGFPVSRVSLSSTDDLLAVAVGTDSICLYRLGTDGNGITMIPCAPAPELRGSITCSCWLAGMLGLGSSTGVISVQVEDSIKQVFQVDPEGRESVQAMCTKGWGLLAAGSLGVLYFFEPPDAEARRAGHSEQLVLSRRLATNTPGRSIVDIAVSPALGHISLLTSASEVLLLDLELLLERSGSTTTSRSLREAASASAANSPPPGPSVTPIPTFHITSEQAETLVIIIIIKKWTTACRVPRCRRGSAGVSLAWVARETALPGYPPRAPRSPARTGADEKCFRTVPDCPDDDPQDHEPFRMLCGGFHSSPVVGLDACALQPLLVAIAADRTVRIWNYQSRRCIVSRMLMDDVLCCALHPSGTLLAVGMRDKLRVFSIAMDELEVVHEVVMKKVGVVRYSPGGGVLAAVGRTNTIMVHSSYSHQQLGSLKGHVSVVTDLGFSADDRTLVSTGAGGAVYFWDMASFKRMPEHEFVDKRSIFTSVQCLNAHIGGCCEKTGVRSRAAITASVLLLADDCGSVWSYPWPREFPARPGALQLMAPPRAYRMHSCSNGAGTGGGSGPGVECMVYLPSRGLLFTASADGVVLISDVTVVMNGALVDLPSAPPLPNYLVLTEEKMALVEDKMHEMAKIVSSARSDAEYQACCKAQLLRDAIAQLEAELSNVRRSVSERDTIIEGLRGGLDAKEVCP
ncbi:MAG: hypothetical protein WDW38_000960 [Sanguina aurantia]